MNNVRKEGHGTRKKEEANEGTNCKYQRNLNIEQLLINIKNNEKRLLQNVDI